MLVVVVVVGIEISQWHQMQQVVVEWWEGWYGGERYAGED